MAENKSGGSALNDPGFAGAVLRSAPGEASLGSVESCSAFVSVFLSDVFDMLAHPDVDKQDRPAATVALVDRAADRILAQSGEVWFAGLPGRIAARYSGTGSDRDLIRQLFMDLALAYVDGLRYANTPGVLPEQWQANIEGLVGDTVDVLLGIGGEDEAGDGEAVAAPATAAEGE